MAGTKEAANPLFVTYRFFTQCIVIGYFAYFFYVHVEVTKKIVINVTLITIHLIFYSSSK